MAEMGPREGNDLGALCGAESSGIRGVIFDWAGTLVDCGCMAPVRALVKVFGRRGIAVSLAEARGPMGLEKKLHIQRLLAAPDIAERWRATAGRGPTDADAEALFQDLEPTLVEAAPRCSAATPGAAELLAALRERHVPVGSTTGYSRTVMEALVPEAARAGVAPDCIVCPSDVPAGRPFPWMCFANAMRLGIYPLRQLVKVGDTPADIAEGLNAGMWSVGVLLCGNETGLTDDELLSLSEGEREERRRDAARRLNGAGAHYVTDSPATLAAVLVRIDERLRSGDMPGREETIGTP